MEREPQPELSGDMLSIEQGIAQAEAEERIIDDATARRIASQLHTGQTSAVYSLASTGAINFVGLASELLRDYADLDDEGRRMTDALGTYMVETGDRGPQEGWYLLTQDD